MTDDAAVTLSEGGRCLSSGNVVYGAVLAGCVLLALALAALAASIAGGSRPAIVHGPSMGDAAPIGSLVMTRRVSPERLAVGDVVIVRPEGDAAPFLHRISAIEPDGDNFLVQTKGDANSGPDPGHFLVSEPQLVYSYHVPYVGFFLAFVGTALGWTLVIGAPVVVGCLLTLRSIWRVNEAPPADPLASRA